jgi:hypothetical protein
MYGAVAVVRDLKRFGDWMKIGPKIEIEIATKIEVVDVTTQCDGAGATTSSSTTTTVASGSVFVTKFGQKFHVEKTCGGLRSRTHPLVEYESCKLCMT